VSWNEGAERLLGYKEREAVGLPAARLYTTEDQTTSRPAQDLRQARDRGASSDERWFERKDKSRLWATSHIVVLRDEDAENVRGYAWIMRDLTDRKRMEEELERRVEARTAELNEAVQELEAFSYSVSHDLRAPLRTIRGFTELVLEEASDRLNEEERGYLDRVHRASTRLDRLIADLLAYTRVSKTKVELRPVNLHALVSDIQREHPEFQQPRADVEIEDSLLPVVGNEAYLTQCITNLVGNAVKFVREGQQPIVRISTERRGDMVRVFVKDNGIGIAAERLNRAFEMFERLHSAGSYEGTGVGLAIVRRAVQRMKGHVGVASEVGKGTTFWLELPGVK
jgi:PAS domain S-box-containing protein